MKPQFAPNDRVSLSVDEAGVAHVRLIRASKLNALDLAMFETLVAAGQALFDWPGLRAVVVSGEGRAFCAGLDLSDMASLMAEGRPPLTERTHGNANLFQQVAMQWRKLPVPVIAAVQGVCFGGGLQIAGGADIRVVAPDTRMAIMEARWGLVPDMGGFALFRDCVRADVLRELTYTAREFSGEEALALGFATQVDTDPLARAQTIAAAIAARNPHAVRAAKGLFNRLPDLTTAEILMQESLDQQAIIGSKNQIEAVRSQMEGRTAQFIDP